MKRAKDSKKGDARFPESDPPYAGDHPAMDFEVSRNGADSMVPGVNVDLKKTPDAEPRAKDRKGKLSR